MSEKMKLPENGWLSVKEIAQLLGINKSAVKKQCAKGKHGHAQKLINGNGGPQYRIHIYSQAIPHSVRIAWCDQNGMAATLTPDQDYRIEGEILASASEPAKRKARKYLAVLKASAGLKGKRLMSFVREWNKTHPDQKTSYSRLVTARKEYTTDGINALLGRWGEKLKGTSSIPDEIWDRFKLLYLKQGGPSIRSCWKMSLGYACEINPQIDVTAFPSHMSFCRRLQSEVSAEAVYRAREGQRAANRKYGFYLDRNYENTPAGLCWVSDHAQIDVACRFWDRQGRERYCFPWVTVWRDFTSGKWLGWDVYPTNPNSDHIFMAFFRALMDFGTCMYAYLDNGKDYRSKDFSGGRKNFKVTVDEVNSRALLGVLGIESVFAWPYNAQSKPVERDFLKNKEWLSKHSEGYRGGNVVERPEDLNAKIRSREIETLDEFTKTFDTFVRQVINRSLVTEGHRAGKCPDQIWEEQAPQAAQMGALKRLSPDSATFFCMRTSGDMTISRRGIHDTDLGIDYYDHWMVAQKGRKVYLRRDPKRFQEAWVFDAKSNDYIGKGLMLQQTPALAITDVDRAKLKADIALRRRSDAIVKSFIKTGTDDSQPISLDEKVQHLATATGAINESRGWTPSGKQVDPGYIITQMDRIVHEDRRMQQIGDNDFSLITGDQPKKIEKDIWDTFAKI